MNHKWLENIRKEKNMTHEAVAVQSKITRHYYTMIENGNRRPSVDVAKRIAAVLGFDWTLFFEQNSNESLQRKV
ncbi:putative HTH-type transcriptional regulator YqaF [Collibacillus ludicampi]|uniref:HTH-type transcriptional regulator YqaF n=1 Tax=Collibacillus ludicampi TaxID=2771369 RepID=A0AAV4LEX8_9BACL|nr:helix-turn-helix transcriptional regulator [Collibacillus ludicampi]GIM46366.1 putative HTH-type transcriptional regulator YqaF [Collibacillus ludicampi]